MKVLAINFGRKNGQCKNFLTFAVNAAQEAGAEVEVVETINLKINRCLGCGACSRMLESGTKQISCIQKDDYEELANKVLAADAIIVAAPVYVLAPVGMVKDFIDRFGPAHDKAYMLFENALREDGKDQGMVPLNPDCLKRHVVSYISVGGATTPHWVSFGIPFMNLFGMSLNMKVVDQVNIFGTYQSQEKKANHEQDCAKLGRRIVEAIPLKNSEVTWESEPGTCPVCHCNEMTMYGTDQVSCPICGIFGTIKMDGHKVTVEFTEEEKNRSRLLLNGVLEHQEELGRKPRYPKYDEYLARFKQSLDVM